jgi:hypothetical protein
MWFLKNEKKIISIWKNNFKFKPPNLMLTIIHLYITFDSSIVKSFQQLIIFPGDKDVFKVKTTYPDIILLRSQLSCSIMIIII